MIPPAAARPVPAPWLPLAERRLIDPSLARIVRELKADASVTPGVPGLFVGRAGLALFFLYYARFTGAPADRAYAESFVGDLFETLPDEVPFTFCAGLAGLAWMLRHAAATGLVDVDADEALQDIDRLLLERMIVEMQAGRWDFLHGALGCSLYLLDTGDRPSSRAALVQVLDELERQAIDDGRLLGWRNPDFTPQDGPPDGFNLGLAHGNPSIINVLARCVRYDVDAERAGILLEKAVGFVLAQELSGRTTGACYPSFTGEADPRRESRLAWCYGDPGIAATLWQAGVIADRPDWTDKAVAILERASLRREPDDTSVTDAGLCHGSAGLALIFARMSHRTGRAAFRDAAMYWLHDTLARAQNADGYAGYRANLGELPDDVATQLSLLMGIAGIGLALMALSSSIDPAWDRAFLLS